MKNILLLIHEDDGQDSRLQVALDVTRALDGHLECLSVMEMPVVSAGFYGAETEALAFSAARDAAAANRMQIERRLAVEDVPWSMAGAIGTSANALEKASGLADLIVMSSRSDGNAKRERPAQLPLKAERPLLAVPPSCKSLDTAGRVIVAWDGSRQCTEAVRDAAPLLKCAREVILLEFDQPEGAFAMADVASYLSRHGVTAELVEGTSKNGIAGAILDHAGHREADLIVMGAYSAPPAAQIVFGGVTRTMLQECEVPLLLSH